MEKKCKPDQILNPQTKRCISKTGSVYKKLIKDKIIQEVKTTTTSSSSGPGAKKNPPKIIPKDKVNKVCPDGKICNREAQRKHADLYFLMRMSAKDFHEQPDNLRLEGFQGIEAQVEYIIAMNDEKEEGLYQRRQQRFTEAFNTNFKHLIDNPEEFHLDNPEPEEFNCYGSKVEWMKKTLVNPMTNNYSAEMVTVSKNIDKLTKKGLEQALRLGKKGIDIDKSFYVMYEEELKAFQKALIARVKAPESAPA
jgi:hypothetical protein